MKFETLKNTSIGGVTLTRFVSNKTAVSAVALMTAFAAVSPAWAGIDNTVTATGTPPSGPDITATADEVVDVEDAAAALVTVKTVTLVGGAPVPADAPAGTVVQYNFAVENTGNVNISNVNINEVSFDGDTSADPTDATVTTDTVDSSTPARTAETTGDSTDGTAGDGIFDTLAPGDIITFTSTYTVTVGDIADEGGGDGTLDNEANASGVAPLPGPGGGLGPVTSPNDTASFDLEDSAASLLVTKVADNDTNRAVGDVITYTYVVTNDGNVPLTEVSLADVVTAGSGTAPTPTLGSLTNTSGNSSDDSADDDIDVLAPGDFATFTGTYIVTQDDVDTLQTP